MRYVLTGYSGMLAAVLDHQLRAAGHENVVPPGQELPTWTSPSSGGREPDFRAGAYRRWLLGEDWDVLIHAGAMVGTTRCEAHPRLIWGCNVDSSAALADVVRLKHRRMVFFASDSEFDPSDYNRDNPIRVNLTKANPHSRYGMSKLAGRLLVEQRVGGEDLLVVYTCFGFGGVMDGNSCVAEMLKCAAGIYRRRPFIPLHPAALKDVTAHRHIARGVEAAMGADLFGRVVVAAGSPMAYRDIVDMVGEVTGVQQDPEWHPELDYKMDLVYDPMDVVWVNSLLDRQHDLLGELTLEWKKTQLGVSGRVAQHEWGHAVALRRDGA